MSILVPKLAKCAGIQARILLHQSPEMQQDIHLENHRRPEVYRRNSSQPFFPISQSVAPFKMFGIR